MFFTKKQFDMAVEKEVQRRMDQFYHDQWMEHRVAKLEEKLEAQVTCSTCTPVHPTEV